ncbi:MAG: hypothetical protein EB059_09145 [Alphaproteobacteria bacterium]|nr:hypothetical protein [Alphaproteobacteria bacterium]
MGAHRGISKKLRRAASKQTRAESRPMPPRKQVKKYSFAHLDNILFSSPAAHEVGLQHNEVIACWNETARELGVLKVIIAEAIVPPYQDQKRSSIPSKPVHDATLEKFRLEYRNNFDPRPPA